MWRQLTNDAIQHRSILLVHTALSCRKISPRFISMGRINCATTWSNSCHNFELLKILSIKSKTGVVREQLTSVRKLSNEQFFFDAIFN